MIGALLGSTDPVAVGALLKELGTPIRLNMILEGESLLNDGVSIVLAFSFRKFFESNPLTIFQILWNVVSLCIGGPLFGLLIGFIFYKWMIRIIKDQVMMVTITFICCFLVFFLCEYPPWNLSGILAIVMASLFLSAQGKMEMRAANMYLIVESVWKFAQFVGESLLFVITGIFVGKQFIQDFKSVPTSEFMIDLGRVCIFFILMNIVRFLMILLFLPFLNHKNNQNEYKIGWKDCVVIAYSGIRGAFPLIICLTILQNESYTPEFKHITSVVTVGVIFLGIMFNGLTIKFLIQWLKLIKPNQAANNLKMRIMIKINQENEAKASHVKEKNAHIGANWRIVDRLCGSFDQKQEHMSRESVRFSMTLKTRKESIGQSDGHEIEGEIRLRIIYYIKAEIMKGVHESECSGEAASILIYACDLTEERSLEGFFLWKNLEGIIDEDLVRWAMSFVDSYPIIYQYLQSYHTIQTCTHFECAYFLVNLLNKIIKQKDSLVPVNPIYTKFLEEELVRNKTGAENYISKTNNSEAGLFPLYQTKRAAKEIIYQRIKMVKSYQEEGLLTEEVY